MKVVRPWVIRFGVYQVNLIPEKGRRYGGKIRPQAVVQGTPRHQSRDSRLEYH
jgi:hypothetical protein